MQPTNSNGINEPAGNDSSVAMAVGNGGVAASPPWPLFSIDVASNQRCRDVTWQLTRINDAQRQQWRGLQPACINSTTLLLQRWRNGVALTPCIPLMTA